MREAIKPRQIINYDAGIVLIDRHQLNVKTTSDNTNQRHWIRGNLMSMKNRTRCRINNPQHLVNQMIEQINTALEHKKGPGISQLWVIEACRRRLRQKREHIHQLRRWRMNIPRSSLRTGRYCNHLSWGHCSNWVAVLPLSWQWQTARWLCHRLNSLNDF